MLLSFRLLQGAPVREEKELACLYAVSNHIKKHYHTAQIPKRNGGVRRLLVPDALLNTIQKNLMDLLNLFLMFWTDFPFPSMPLPTKRKPQCWTMHFPM